MLELLRIALGLILLIFLPGMALVYALFPRKGDLDLEYDTLYRIFLGVGFSVVITILIGFILNLFGVKDDGTGFFTDINIIISLLSITLICAVIAWFRGAFPILGKIHPILLREAERGQYEMGGGVPFIEPDEKDEIEKLTRKRISFNRRLSMLDRRPTSGSVNDERKELLAKLRVLNDRLEELEAKRKGGI